MFSRNAKSIGMFLFLLQVSAAGCAKTNSQAQSVFGSDDSQSNSGPAKVSIVANNIEFGLSIEELEEQGELSQGFAKHIPASATNKVDPVDDAQPVAPGSTYPGYDQSGTGGNALGTGTQLPNYKPSTVAVVPGNGVNQPNYNPSTIPVVAGNGINKPSDSKNTNAYDYGNVSNTSFDRQLELNKLFRLEVVVKVAIPLPSANVELSNLRVNIGFLPNGASQPVVSQNFFIDPVKKQINPMTLQGHFKEQHIGNTEQITFIIDNVYSELMGRPLNQASLIGGTFSYTYNLVDKTTGVVNPSTFNGNGKFSVKPVIDVAKQSYKDDDQHKRAVVVRAAGWSDGKTLDDSKLGKAYQDATNWNSAEHQIIQGVPEDSQEVIPTETTR